MHFEWDETKAAKNLAKHGIGFSLASRVFLDPLRLTVTDHRHASEHRQNTTVTVTHTDRAGVTRLISARKASRKERAKYHANH